MENTNKMGVVYAVLAYSLWGILPVYWKLIDNIPPTEILAHRILWAFIFVTAILAYKKKWGEVLEGIKDRNTLLLTICASIAITINWGIYIWAVNSDHIVEASMGYYINPLVVVFIGVLFFKERLDRWQVTALILAFIGVCILTVQYGKVPWISVALAFSFGMYGGLKKFISLQSLAGLALETAIITPFALTYIVIMHISGVGAIGNIPASSIPLLLGTGVITAIPLLLFAKGAKMIPLSMLGFTQYISPSISLVLGVFLYNESFTTTHLFSFGFIWLGLLVYSLSQLLHEKPGITASLLE